MDSLAEAVAKNYYLQSLAIFVAVGTLAVALVKVWKWLSRFFREVVKVGIRQALLQRYRAIIRSAYRDARDPILYSSRVTHITTRLAEILIVMFLLLALTDLDNSKALDHAVFGNAFSDKFYYIGRALVQALVTIFFTAVVLALFQLRTYTFYVRRRRRKILLQDARHV